MKSRFVTIGIAGMFLMAACSTSYNAQKTSNDDLYSAGSSQEAPLASTNRQVQSSSASSQVIDPTVIEDRSDDQSATPDNYSQNNYSPNSYNNNYDNSNSSNTYNGYSDGNNGSQWSDASMNRMGCASASFGYYGPSYSGFTFYSPLYYSPGFSLSLGFSFGAGSFYNPGWNSFGWMPMPPPVYYPYYPMSPYMYYNPYYMNAYAFGDPYGYYGGYYGGYYPYNNYNQYYGPRNSTSNNTSGNGRVYVPEHRNGNGSGNTIPGVTPRTNSGSTTTTRTTAPLASPQVQNQRRFNPNAPAVAPRMAPAPNTNSNNSGRPKNQYRPVPQAYNMPQENQPVVVYRNNMNQQRMENSQGFHQSLNQENNSRGFDQHAVQSSGRNSSTSSSGTNTPHSNGNRQYR